MYKDRRITIVIPCLNEELGIGQVLDELPQFVDEVIAENPRIVADVKAGKQQAVGSLVGQLMKKTKGRANPQLANDLFRKRL